MKTPLSSSSFFDLREAGQSLEEVAVDIVHTEDQDVTSRWYHSPLDVDLFLWFDQKNNLIKQQLNICGQITEWNIVDGVRTGYVIENEDLEEKNTFSHITYDSTVQNMSLRQAMDVLSFIEVIPEKQKKIMLSNFKTSPRLDRLSPYELLARYGTKPQRGFKAFVAKWLKKLFK